MISVEEMVKLRLQRSKEALSDAVFLLRGERYMAAVDRMYYAAYHMINAYFASQNIKPSQGNAELTIKIFSNLELKGLLKPNDIEVFDRLIEMKEASDYDDFIVISKHEANVHYVRTKAFIQKLQTLITINE